MARPSRRKHQEDEGQHDRWLITYSDLITLLLIFFVIMYAMSQINQTKFSALKESLASALHQSPNISANGVGTSSLIQAGNPTDAGHKLNPGAATKATSQDKTFNALYEKINNYIHQHNLQAKVTLKNDAKGIQITFRDVVLFDTGKAVIKPQAKKILSGLEPFLASVKNPIVIEGYTDDQPIHTTQFPSNWELSAIRAVNVVRFYENDGIHPNRLSEVGYGQYHPLVPNNSTANRQKNRRVNIVIVRNPANTVGSASQSSVTAPSQQTTATASSPGTFDNAIVKVPNTANDSTGGGGN